MKNCHDEGRAHEWVPDEDPEAPEYCLRCDAFPTWYSAGLPKPKIVEPRADSRHEPDVRNVDTPHTEA